MASCESLDPRIRRTRRLLQEALEKVLKTKEFDKISVQDIAAAATVNRATFYDHYDDKFALLECLVGERFHQLLSERQVSFDGRCAAHLSNIILAVCDYLVQLQGDGAAHGAESHIKLAIVAVVRGMLLEGLRNHPREGASPEVVAATASWAIYGAVREWLMTCSRCPAEELARTVTVLVAPILAIPLS